MRSGLIIFGVLCSLIGCYKSETVTKSSAQSKDTQATPVQKNAKQLLLKIDSSLYVGKWELLGPGPGVRKITYILNADYTFSNKAEFVDNTEINVKGKWSLDPSGRIELLGESTPELPVMTAYGLVIDANKLNFYRQLETPSDQPMATYIRKK